MSSKPTADELDMLIDRQQKALDLSTSLAFRPGQSLEPYAPELERAAAEWQTLEALQLLKEYL